MSLAMLLQPLQFEFMRDALLITALVAVPTALLSCFLVLKGWALLGDAISHAVFPGVVIAYMAGLPYALGAFVAGLGCALAAGYLNIHSRIKQDALLGIVFSAMFAVGLLLYTAIRSDIHLDHILFGDVLGAGPVDLLESALIALVIGGWVLLKWKDLLVYAFSPIQAKTVGLNTGILHYGLLAAVSLAVVGALKAVGIILVVALLIAPGAIAFLLVRTLRAMLLVALAVALLCGLSGVYLSFFIDSAPAPTVVLTLSAVFVLSLLLAQWRRRAAVAQMIQT